MYIIGTKKDIHLIDIYLVIYIYIIALLEQQDKSRAREQETSGVVAKQQKRDPPGITIYLNFLGW